MPRCGTPWFLVYVATTTLCHAGYVQLTLAPEKADFLSLISKTPESYHQG